MEKGPQWIFCRGKLDPDCKDNWVLLDIVKRADSGSKIAKTDQNHIHIALCGQHVESRGTITLSWYADNASNTR